MKDIFTIKEIMEGTGLTRQRVHALIKSGNIKAKWDRNKLIIKWDDLLQLADNDKMLDFLRLSLKKEKMSVDASYLGLREQAKGMMYAYRLLLEKESPTPEGEDLEWIRQFRKAYFYWWKMPGWYGAHWSLEADKYDYLDEENID